MVERGGNVNKKQRQVTSGKAEAGRTTGEILSNHEWHELHEYSCDWCDSLLPKRLVRRLRRLTRIQIAASLRSLQ
jgi:hypothetical protein